MLGLPSRVRSIQDFYTLMSVPWDEIGLVEPQLFKLNCPSLTTQTDLAQKMTSELLADGAL